MVRRMMRIRKLSGMAGILLACVLLGGPGAAQGSSFQMIVHSSNPTSRLSKEQIAKLFLRKTRSWGHGLEVQAVDQATGRSVRQAFSQEIHGKEVAWVENYWRMMIFSGRSTPPVELDSDRAVLEYVRANSGAVGYVSVGASVGSEVKVVRITD